MLKKLKKQLNRIVTVILFRIHVSVYRQLLIPILIPILTPILIMIMIMIMIVRICCAALFAKMEDDGRCLLSAVSFSRKSNIIVPYRTVSCRIVPYRTV